MGTIDSVDDMTIMVSALSSLVLLLQISNQFDFHFNMTLYLDKCMYLMT